MALLFARRSRPSPSAQSATGADQGYPGRLTAMDEDPRKAPPCTLTIFGASGDLTERKLLPAIRQLAAHSRLPKEFALIGVARSAMSDEAWASRYAEDGELPWPPAAFRYVSGDYDDPETYR